VLRSQLRGELAAPTGGTSHPGVHGECAPQDATRGRESEFHEKGIDGTTRCRGPMKNAARRAAPIATQPARQIARKNYIPKRRRCFRFETVPRCVLAFTDAFHCPQVYSKTLADI